MTRREFLSRIIAVILAILVRRPVEPALRRFTLRWDTTGWHGVQIVTATAFDQTGVVLGSVSRKVRVA